MKLIILLCVGLLVGMLVACAHKDSPSEIATRTLIADYELKVAPLDHGYQMGEYTAYTTGKDADYAKYTDAKVALNNYHINKDAFEQVKSLRNAKDIKDPLLKRSLEVIYNQYLQRQGSPEKLAKIAEMESAIAKKFLAFRATVDGQILTDNQIDQILRKSSDPAELKKVWAASKEVGGVVADDVVAMVKIRNEMARELGYKNFHELSLAANDQSVAEVTAVFDELDTLTREPFMRVKNRMDGVLAAQLHVDPKDLGPWAYQNRFFQEPPQITSVDFDAYYKNQSILALVTKAYQSMGMEVADILAKSDLFERAGKDQHAACWNLDRQGDTRILANIQPNEYWTSTMMHELGHAVFIKYMDFGLPFTIRTESHILTTEAIAQMMESFTKNPLWMMDMVGLDAASADKIAKDAREMDIMGKLVFSRWSQVMFRFEKALYENPDQDLNKLWWDLVAKYQLVQKPADRHAPDWASKIHFTTSPCYYHNYLLGEVFASQLRATIAKDVLKVADIKKVNFSNHPEVGQFLINKVFKPSGRYYWNDLIKFATGEKMTAKYYANEINEM